MNKHAKHEIGPQSTFLGHPRGLTVLFLTEMWERFSYYGMRAILTLYLIKHFLFQDRPAYALYGAYTALAFLTPAIGGYVSDRWLGARKAVILGGSLLVIGHFLMALQGEGAPTVADVNLLYIALSFIIVGVGFLKANVSVLVGSLYDRGDRRRDSAFTIFYMGINVGAASGALLVGYLGERLGWSYGFGAAGLGMVVGLIIFNLGSRFLVGKGAPPDPAGLRERVAGITREGIIYLGSLGGVAVIWLLVKSQAIVGFVLGGAGGILVVYILFTSVRRLAPVERDRIIAAIVLMMFAVMFYALSEQAGSSLSVFTDRSVNRSISGLVVPASVFLAINPILIVLLAPSLTSFWRLMAKRNQEPSTPAKFGIGIICLGAGFLALVVGAQISIGQTPAVFILIIYFLHTLGELCLAPIGLAAMSRLAIPRMVGLIIGTWFFAQAGGNYLAGVIASAGAGESGSNHILSVYLVLGWAGIASGIAILHISTILNRLMHTDAQWGVGE